VLVPLALAAIACSKDNDGIRCSFANPPIIDTAPDQWPKFRRDLQNTGTIVLAADAYARVAADNAGEPAAREIAWTYPAASDEPTAAFVGSPSLNSGAEALYIASTAGQLIGIRTAGDRAGTLIRIENENGSRDFLTSSEPFSITTTPLVATRDDLDAVFIGTGSGRLLGVSGAGDFLQQIWPNVLDTAVGTSPTLSLNGSIFAGSLGSGMFATCPNGVTRFQNLSGATLSSPALGRRGTITDTDEFIYFGADDGLLRAVREDGILQWSVGLSAPILAAPIVVLDNSDPAETFAVIVVDANGRIARVTADGRAVSGFVGPTGIGRVVASPALAAHPNGDSRLYVASMDAGLHAIDADTGALRWSWDPGTGIESSPAVVLSASGTDDPIVIFGGDDGRLYYVRDTGADAELVATFDPTTEVPLPSSPAIGPDGTVYFGGLDGRVYAVR